MDDLTRLIQALQRYPAFLARIRELMTEEELLQCDAGQAVFFPQDKLDPLWQRAAS